MKTKKQEILGKLVEICGPKRQWKSRSELIEALGWAESVSPLLNRLVAERLVDQMPMIGEGVNGRICSGFRPAKERKAVGEAPVLLAIQALDEVRARLAEIAQSLRDASGTVAGPPHVVS